MESQRSFLIIALIFLTYLLYIQWQNDYGPEPVTQQQTTEDIAAIPGEVTPNSDIPASDIAPSANQQQVQSQRLISVKTPIMDFVIDTRGGKIIKGDLLEYPVELDSEEPVHLLSERHQAISGLLGLEDANGKRINTLQYSSEQTEYVLKTNSEPLTIPLTWNNGRGITVSKTYTIKPDDYDVAVNYSLTNNSNSTQPVQQYAELKKLILAAEASLMMQAYNAATYSTVDERYEKYDFSDMLDQNLLKNTIGGWVAMQQHYFVAAWVPTQTEPNKIYSRVAPDGSAVIGYRGPVYQVEPGQTQTMSTTLYAGPKIQKRLGQLSETLELTVDYGPLWFISKFLFWLLSFLYNNVVANWGVAIILITVIVKFAMYPLTKKQTVSMAKMRNLQPKLQALKEKYGDDRQKMGPAMMELYRKEQVNPMGGCLPLLLQMPIFLALFWMLMESVELRHAPFMLWIDDLSALDPLYILPVLYGASMFLMQKITPTPTTDPMQQKMMLWMPVVFSIFFLWFPSGLVLYWLVNNLISIGQTLYIYRQIDNKGLADGSNKTKTAK